MQNLREWRLWGVQSRARLGRRGVGIICAVAVAMICEALKSKCIIGPLICTKDKPVESKVRGSQNKIPLQAMCVSFPRCLSEQKLLQDCRQDPRDDQGAGRQKRQLENWTIEASRRNDLSRPQDSQISSLVQNEHCRKKHRDPPYSQGCMLGVNTLQLLSFLLVLLGLSPGSHIATDLHIHQHK